MDSAALSLDSIFKNTKGHVAFQKQMLDMAEKYEKTTRISAPQFMKVAAIVGNMTQNMAATKVGVKAVLEYAFGTGQQKNLTAAARQFMTGVGSGRLPNANILLTGGSSFQKFKQAVDEVHKRYGGLIGKDAQTASAKLIMLGNSVSRLASIIFNELAPALKQAIIVIEKLIAWLKPFVETHKTLVTTMAKAAFYVTGFLVALVALGAVAGALVMPFHLLKFAIAGINFALELNPVVRAITILGILATVLWEVAGGIEGVKKSMEGMWGRLTHPLDTLLNAPSNPLDYFSRVGQAGGVDNYNKIHMTINVNDKGGHVGSVHAANAGSSPMIVNLGRNMR
jgi:hypothetical protein